MNPRVFILGVWFAFLLVLGFFNFHAAMALFFISGITLWFVYLFLDALGWLRNVVRRPNVNVYVDARPENRNPTIPDDEHPLIIINETRRQK